MIKPVLMSCLIGLVVIGCGRSNGPPTAVEADKDLLFQVGEMYRSYQTTKNRPPTKLAEIAPMRAISGNAYEALRTGEVVLRYDAPMTDLQEEPGPPSSDEILAYQKIVPEKGGQVLMLDRNVKTMTAEEFKSAKKAGKN